jgi:hypothetical protein
MRTLPTTQIVLLMLRQWAGNVYPDYLIAYCGNFVLVDDTDS